MAKVLRTVAIVASAVALVTPGLQQFGVIGLKAAATIGTVAGLTAAVAGIGASLLAPKPIAKGSPARFVIDIGAHDTPRPERNSPSQRHSGLSGSLPRLLHLSPPACSRLA